MTLNGWLQIALFCALVLIVVKPLGVFMAGLFAGERNFLTPVLGPIERGFYRLAGVNPTREQHWTTYAIAMLVFNFAGILALYALQRFQNLLPLNPQGFDAVGPELSFNTAVSFATNTNWQSYAGEIDDELSRPDAGADGAELSIGGHRHRAGDRVRARFRARTAPRRSVISGPISRAPRSTCCCRSRSSSRW